MITSELQARLNRLGFAAGATDGIIGPLTRTAVARFQIACALPGHNLVVDAIPGSRTHAALIEAGDTGRLAPHFSVAELRTRTRSGGPKDGTCYVHRELLHALERLRSAAGVPLPVVSGWRDEAHNRRVGGARSSQHTFGVVPELERISSRLARVPLTAGRAADIPRGLVPLELARSVGVFGGVGHVQGWATHVDVRPGDPRNPTLWRY